MTSHSIISNRIEKKRTHQHHHHPFPNGHRLDDLLFLFLQHYFFFFIIIIIIIIINIFVLKSRFDRYQFYIWRKLFFKLPSSSSSHRHNDYHHQCFFQGKNVHSCCCHIYLDNIRNFKIFFQEKIKFYPMVLIR